MCVSVCDLETSRRGGLGPILVVTIATGKKQKGKKINTRETGASKAFPAGGTASCSWALPWVWL